MKKLILGSTLILSSCGFTQAESGFDDICAIYSDHTYSGQSVGELWILISEQVYATVDEEEVVALYSALEIVNRAHRYNLFSNDASKSLGRYWSRPKMREVLETAATHQ